MIAEVWRELPAAAQDGIALVLLILPSLGLGLILARGFRVWPLVRAQIGAAPGTNALFVLLMALAVALGTGITAQERALAEGSARAADRFGLIVAAPGDRVQMLMAAVYLRPTDVPLLGGAVLARLQADPDIALLAPIAFGDTLDGRPVVGTTAAFVQHLAGPLAEGRAFAALGEAVVGAAVDLAPGERFTPVHGHGGPEDAHDGVEVEIVGRMAPTGSPWDRAILVPVEEVWATHGLATGHPPDAPRIGPPFDPEFFPGTPAFLVHASRPAALYALQARHGAGEAMAFFPATVLAELHALMGDLRRAFSLMAGLAQALVAIGVLAALMALIRPFARRFALLRALGAPRRFVLAVVWGHAAALIAAGGLLGLAIGHGAAIAIGRLVTARTDIRVEPALGWTELHMVAAFVSLMSLAALLPGLAAYRRSAVADLRMP